jgi:hypothetical protein
VTGLYDPADDYREEDDGDYYDPRDDDHYEPDPEAYEIAKAEEEHCQEVHGGRDCDCPVPTPEEIAARWEASTQQHRADAHGSGPCDCDDEPPF